MNGAAETVVDGVHRYPANGIKVIIVGAGNGGLNAALECWRKGCDVVVLERAKEISPIGMSSLPHEPFQIFLIPTPGDFFTITPSALVTMKHYPNFLKKYHANVHNCSIHVYTPSGHAMKSTMPERKREGILHACPEIDVSFLNRRPEYAAWQLDQVRALGIPVHFSTKCIDVTEVEDKVIVHTEKGDFEVDVCVAADGIGSKVPWPIPGGFVDVKDSGCAVARVAFPRGVIKKGSPAE